jgi:hypothetical protein
VKEFKQTNNTVHCLALCAGPTCVPADSACRSASQRLACVPSLCVLHTKQTIQIQKVKMSEMSRHVNKDLLLSLCWRSDRRQACSANIQISHWTYSKQSTPVVFQFFRHNNATRTCLDEHVSFRYPNTIELSAMNPKIVFFI